ncbi:CHD9 protein, partial [Polyodon spathula]|nr:CHD9 protein [Polyodon spathula]
MTDPMMDFFDDANLFGGGLEGLADDSFAQTDPVSLVDELGLGAEFEPLQVEPLGQVKQPGNPPSQPGLCFEQQMSQFEPLKGHHHHHRQQGGQPFSIPNESTNNGLPRHSQYTASPLHQPSQSNGLFPDMVDGSPMWGNQNEAQFHQNHGNLHPFNPGGQEAMSQSSSFLEVHSSSPVGNVHQPDRLSSRPAPCQTPPAVSVHHFSNPVASVSLSFPGQSSSSTLNLPACSVNASSLFPPAQCSFSGTSNGGTLLSSTPGSGHSLGVSDFPGGNRAFPLMAGTNGGASLQPSRYPQAINPSCENAFQAMHSGLGSFSGSPMSTEDMGCYPAVVSRSSDTLGHAIPPAEPPLSSSNGFPTLEEHLLQQVQSHSEAFPELDTDGLLEEDLLPQFEAAFGPQDPSCMQEETQVDSGSNNSWPDEGGLPGDFQQQVGHYLWVVLKSRPCVLPTDKILNKVVFFVLFVY